MWLTAVCCSSHWHATSLRFKLPCTDRFLIVIWLTSNYKTTSTQNCTNFPKLSTDNLVDVHSCVFVVEIAWIILACLAEFDFLMTTSLRFSHRISNCRSNQLTGRCAWKWTFTKWMSVCASICSQANALKLRHVQWHNNFVIDFCPSKGNAQALTSWIFIH